MSEQVATTLDREALRQLPAREAVEKAFAALQTLLQEVTKRCGVVAKEPDVVPAAYALAGEGIIPQSGLRTLLDLHYIHHLVTAGVAKLAPDQLDRYLDTVQLAMMSLEAAQAAVHAA